MLEEVKQLKFSRKLFYGALTCLIGAASAAPMPALALSPLSSPTESIRALRSQALEKRMKRDTQGALDAYEEALELSKKEFGANSTYVAQIYYDLGSLALESNKFQRAEDYLTNAVRINPNSVAARVMLADLLITRERPEEAARQAHQALIKHPNAETARQVLARAYLHASRQVQQEVAEHPESGMDGQALALAYQHRATQEFAHLEATLHGRNAPVPTTTARPTAASPAAQITPPAVKPEEKPVTAAKGQPKSADRPVKLKPEEKPKAPEVKPKVKPQPKPEAKPQPKPEAKPQPKPEAKPQPKPEAKPQPKPEAKPQPKPETTPQPPKVPPAPKPARAHGGLVPPPPPIVPSFPNLVPPPPAGYGNPTYQLNTKATIQPKEKPKEKPKPEAPKEDKQPAASTSGADDDFLLEWADKGSKKKK
jgi:hypothetical protein